MGVSPYAILLYSLIFWLDIYNMLFIRNKEIFQRPFHFCSPREANFCYMAEKHLVFSCIQISVGEFTVTEHCATFEMGRHGHLCTVTCSVLFVRNFFLFYYIG